MTESEYRDALESLTTAQFESFCRAFGGDADTVGARVQEFVYHLDRPRLERIIVFRLREVVAGIGIRTEEEKLSDASVESARAAMRSAAAAEQSAHAASSSATSAWYAVVVGIVAAVVTLAVARGC